MKMKSKNTSLVYKLQGSKFWGLKGFKRIIFKNFKRIFLIGQKLGFHIIPNHFYYPVPDTRLLTNKIFTSQSKLIGLEMNEKEQLELLSIFEFNFKNEFNKFPHTKTKVPYHYYTTNGNFRSVDGEILYCMIRYFKPKKIIEIGSGYSTFCSAQAILKNQELYDNYNCELIAIEPYPNKTLRKGFPGLSHLIPTQLQKVPIEIFTELGENDILFIDSSHILNIGNDVFYEFIEILPRLKKGVIVHIHDIYLPLEYPPELVLNLLCFFNEQYLLQSFLAFNDTFKVLWAAKYMQLKYSDKLENVFYSFKKDKAEMNGFDSNKKYKVWPIMWPSSFWIKRIN